MLTDFFDGKELCKSINPDEAIAFGATIEAAILSGTDHSKITKEVVVVDILPLSLGVESSKGVMTTVIKRKTNIPIKKTMLFSTIQNNQPNVDLKVWIFIFYLFYSFPNSGEKKKIKLKNFFLSFFFFYIRFSKEKDYKQNIIN